jgi:hypothetical protein
MPLRFGPCALPHTRQVLQFQVDAPLFIVGGSDRSFELETPLHWLPAQSRAVPCTREDCPWHHLPARICVYVPCLAYSWSSRCWKEKVLALTERMQEWLSEPREKVVYEFVRRKYRNAPVSWAKSSTHHYSLPFSGFDCETSLRKLWGMYANAKKTNDRVDVEPMRLFTDADAAAAG